MNKKIFIVGSLAYDKIMNYPGRFSDDILPDKIHVLSVSFYIPVLEEKFGGTAGNIAYSLAHLGFSSAPVCSTGGDFSSYKKHLKEIGVDTGAIREYPELISATAHVITDAADNQIAAFYPGAMSKPCWEEGLLKEWDKDSALVVISPGNKEDMSVAVLECIEYDVPYIYDPGQQIPHIPEEDLKKGIFKAEAFIVNDYEFELVEKKIGLSKEEIVSKIKRLIVTYGEEGSELIEGGAGVHIPAVKIKDPIDPTGAGDGYRAGLIAGLMHGFDWKKSVRIASVVASYPVGCYGTQDHIFDWEEVKEKYKKEFGKS